MDSIVERVGGEAIKSLLLVTSEYYTGTCCHVTQYLICAKREVAAANPAVVYEIEAGAAFPDGRDSGQLDAGEMGMKDFELRKE